MFQIKCLIVAAVTCFPSAGLAQAFTFEGLTPGQYLNVIQTIGGQTLTVVPLPVSPGLSSFLFVGPSGVPLLGTVSLEGRVLVEGRPFVDGIQFSFLNPVSAITFAFGDAGGDDDSPARIQAFDAFGNVLGVFDTPYPVGKNDGATRTLTFGGVGASSFVLSSFSHDESGDVTGFFWEVAASTPAAPTTAPEPTPVALVGSGLILLGVVYRRRDSGKQRRSRL